MRRRRRWLLVKLVLALVFTEGLLRVGVYTYAHTYPRPHCGAEPALLQRLYYAYRGGEQMEVTIPPRLMVADPRRGHKLGPGYRDRDIFGYRLSSNSRGARGAREYPVPKPAGVRRVVALGDSFTFGQGVSDHETWPAQLEALWPGTEFVNLGGSAYAHDQMYFALLDDGLPLQPDVVVLGFYEPDVQRNIFTFYCHEKPRFARANGGWEIENLPTPSPEEIRATHLWQPLVYLLPRLLLERLQAGGRRERPEEQAREILGRIRAETEKTGARFVMVHLPEAAGAPPDPRAFFYRYCAESGAECVDTAPAFQRAVAAGERDFTLPNDLHYNARGYTIVARALQEHFTATAPPPR